MDFFFKISLLPSLGSSLNSNTVTLNLMHTSQFINILRSRTMYMYIKRTNDTFMYI